MENNSWTLKRILAIAGILLMISGFLLMTVYYFGYFAKLGM